MPDCVHLAVDASTARLTADDRVLADALAERGVAVEPVVWGAPVPAGATVVLRSVWDYVDEPSRFRAWLDTLDAAGVVVHNDTAMVRWNMHKAYLLALAERGVPVVSTTVVAAGTTDADLAAIMDEHGWTDAVVKPTVGGTARRTIHVARTGMAEAARHLRAQAAVEDTLVQPFLPAVLDSGETSVIAVAGDVTHVVRKRPAAGDWRVQSDFGGVSERVPIEPWHVAIARTVLGALDRSPTYARVDVVKGADGAPLLMELELVEPELFFILARDAATRLATVLSS